MKVLLVNPPSSNDNSQISFPINLMILSSVIEEMDSVAEVLDLDYMLKTKQIVNDDQIINQMVDIISNYNIQHIGFTTNCSNYPMVIELAKRMSERKPSSFLFLGGPQASVSYYETLQQFDFIDLIVVGEGEIILRELVANKFNLSRKITGIAYRHQNNIIYTNERDLIENLDDSPDIKYDSISITKYWDEIKQNEIPVFPIEVGRGCPYNCTFCSSSIFWKQKYRTKSVDKVIAEIKQLMDQYGINRFNFVHDNLTFNNRYCEEISSRIIEENLDIQWNCSSRIDQINEDLVRLMHMAGCRGIFFGIETGSPRLQRSIRKGINLDKVIDTLKLVKNIGIKATTSFIIGFPDETEEEYNQTIQLALDCRLSGSPTELQILSPMVRTDLFSQYKNLCFYSENIYQRLWYDDASLEIYPQLKDNKEAFSFFYSYKGKFLDFYFVLFSYLLFLLTINNSSVELKEYLQNTNISFSEIAKEYFRKYDIQNIVKERDKTAFFSTVYKCYQMIRKNIHKEEAQ